MSLRVLVVTGGHPFDTASFAAMFDAMTSIAWAHAVQPAAQRWLEPAHAGEFDAVVCYDLPGIELRRGDGAFPSAVPTEVVAGLTGLLAAGQGMVFLHHALAGWPVWAEWAEVLGGRFLYVPGRVRGTDWPDSGYRRELRQRIRVVAPDHPVCEGVDPVFELVDEAYLAPIFEDDVVPLLRTDAPRTWSSYASPVLALRGEYDASDGWTHPPTSDLAGWATSAGRSPIVYLQPGDGPGAFAHDGYRRLLSNAIRWVASSEAHAWARDRAPRAGARPSRAETQDQKR